jgi:outer membrane protein assembly factor BamA
LVTFVRNYGIKQVFFLELEQIKAFMKHYFAQNILYAALILIFTFISGTTYAQEEEPKDTTAGKFEQTFNKFNDKAEKFFKIAPFPMVTYATETGVVFGLVKYNLVNLVKSDTISTPSSFSELFSISTKGQIKVVLGTQQYFVQNKLILRSEVQYVDYPDLIWGVGNDVSPDDLESIVTKRFVFDNGAFVSLDTKQQVYLGFLFRYTNYTRIDFDSNSFFTRTKYPGYKGGVSSGIGLGMIYDTRDNRYNSYTGSYASINIIGYDGLLGSYYNYYSYELDLRHFIQLRPRYIIGMQLYAMGNSGDVPFYSLGMAGGTERMRGYYYGSIRDKMIMNTQVEFRMPIWNIFGVVGFLSAGRVGEDWSDMSLDGLWYSGGFGLRIMVDRANRANIQIDFGYGERGSKTVVLGFAEAF